MTRYERNAKKLLRQGVARAVVERYLGGSKLMDLLLDCAWIPCRTFDDFLRTSYTMIAMDALNGRNPLFDMLRGVRPKVGRWGR